MITHTYKNDGQHFWPTYRDCGGTCCRNCENAQKRKANTRAKEEKVFFVFCFCLGIEKENDT